MSEAFDLTVEILGEKRAERFLAEINMVLTVSEQREIHPFGKESEAALQTVRELAERLSLTHTPRAPRAEGEDDG